MDDNDKYLKRGDYNINRDPIEIMGLDEIHEAENIYSKEKLLCKLINIKQKENILNEIFETIKIHRKYFHNNIIKLVDTYRGKKTLYLFFDFIEGKLLKSYVDEGKRFKEKEIYLIMDKVLDAIIFLYNNKIILRDLKLENIFIEKNEKIILCNLDNKSLLSKVKQDYKIKNAYIRTALRIGIIICELLDFNKFTKFLHKNGIKKVKEENLNLIQNYYKNYILQNGNLSSDLKNLICELLKNEDNRINITDIRAHEFFKLYSDNDLKDNQNQDEDKNDNGNENLKNEPNVKTETNDISNTNTIRDSIVSSIRDSVNSININNKNKDNIQDKEETIISDEPYLEYYQKEREVLLGLIDFFDENEIKNNMKLAEKYIQEKDIIKNNKTNIFINNINNINSNENDMKTQVKKEKEKGKKKGIFSWFACH